MTFAMKVQKLGELAPQDAAYQLFLFAAGLTVLARGAYSDESHDDSATLRAINEIMHQVTQQGSKTLRNEARYPDDVFGQIIGEMCTESGLLDNCAKVWDRSWQFTVGG